MTELLLAVLTWLVTPNDADALRRTAPSYLDAESAARHLAGARAAGAVYGLDPDLLLAVAWRESRYQSDEKTPESGGRVSCGVMTPTPIARCPPQSLLQGYLAGAEHMRMWATASPTMRIAELGYAGGYRLIRRCQDGPLIQVRGSLRRDLCKIPDVSRARVAWIKRERVTAVKALW